MLEFSSDQDNFSSELAFGNLAPPQQQKSLPFKPVNQMLKMRIDRQLQSKVKKSKRRSMKREQRSRSRSLGRRRARNGDSPFEQYKLDQATSKDIDGDARCKEQCSEEGREKRGTDVIIISDDQESSPLNEFEALERSIYRPFQLQGLDRMNWKERRKIDRLLERGLRHFREGKPRDQLSFSLFNTIEAYFK